MKKEVKKLLNCLKCPICNSPIDILINKSKFYNYGCALDNNHYLISLDENLDNNYLLEEAVNVFSYPNYYKIVQNYCFDGAIDTTTVVIKKIDKENNILDRDPSQKLNFAEIIFKFNKLNIKKIINKINAIVILK